MFVWLISVAKYIYFYTNDDGFLISMLFNSNLMYFNESACINKDWTMFLKWWLSIIHVSMFYEK